MPFCERLHLRWTISRFWWFSVLGCQVDYIKLTGAYRFKPMSNRRGLCTFWTSSVDSAIPFVCGKLVRLVGFNSSVIVELQYKLALIDDDYLISTTLVSRKLLWKVLQQNNSFQFFQHSGFKYNRRTQTYRNRQQTVLDYQIPIIINGYVSWASCILMTRGKTTYLGFEPPLSRISKSFGGKYNQHYKERNEIDFRREGKTKKIMCRSE